MSRLPVLLPVLLLWTCLRVTSATSCCTPANAWLTRRLEKEGFHRDLVTTVQLPWSPSLSGCRLLLFERLPAGVYVDPYQLARLHGVYHRVLTPVDIEAMAHQSGRIDVLSWAELNTTDAKATGQATAVVTLPLHARYHRADETERVASVYIESPRVLLNCEWDDPTSDSAGDEDGEEDVSVGCKCDDDEGEWFSCRATDDSICAYHPVQTDNSPTAVLLVPLGDLRDLELVLVGTAAAVTGGTVLLLLVISNSRVQASRRR